MKTAASATASCPVLARPASPRESQRSPGATQPAATGLRQYQVLQSRSEPGQRKLALRMR